MIGKQLALMAKVSVVFPRRKIEILIVSTVDLGVGGSSRLNDTCSGELDETKDQVDCPELTWISLRNSHERC